MTTKRFVKILSDDRIDELENKINEFLSSLNETHTIKDIKFINIGKGESNTESIGTMIIYDELTTS